MLIGFLCVCFIYTCNSSVGFFIYFFLLSGQIELTQNLLPQEAKLKDRADASKSKQFHLSKQKSCSQDL